MSKIIVLLACLLTALPLGYFKFYYNKPTAGTVVFLNGTSSSGKTTALDELKKLDYTYKILNMDDFEPGYIKAHPTTELDVLDAAPDSDQKAKEQLKQLTEKYNRNMFDSFYFLVRDEALKGNNILVDTILDDAEFKQLAHILQSIKTRQILLYCPLDVAVSRVMQRNAAGVPGEHRDLIQPIGHYFNLYKPQENAAEPAVDTVSSKDMKRIFRDAIDEFMKTVSVDLKDKATKQLEDGYKEFVQHFKLDELDKVVIVPAKQHDLILNCKKAPQELAQEIVHFIAPK